VPVETSGDVAGEADVVPVGVSVAAEDVDEAPGFHAVGRGRNDAEVACGRSRGEPPVVDLMVENYAIGWTVTGCRKCRCWWAASASASTRTDVERVEVVSAFARLAGCGETDFARGELAGSAGGAGLDEARRSRAKSGWEAGIRTPITASRAPCPTVERPPSTGRGLMKAGTVNSIGPRAGHTSQPASYETRVARNSSNCASRA